MNEITAAMDRWKNACDAAEADLRRAQHLHRSAIAEATVECEERLNELCPNARITLSHKALES